MAVKREHREPTYADPDDIALTLGLPDQNDPMGLFRFTDVSSPTYDFVERLILSSEDEIDSRIQRSYRINHVKNHIASLPKWEEDLNGVRAGYHRRGGYAVQLHRWMLPIDPTEGDRIEIRTSVNNWRDITDGYQMIDTVDPDGGQSPPGAWWVDPEAGRLFVRVRLFQTPYNAVRVSYRWGTEEPVPEGISRLCCLMTARKIVNMGVYDVKVGVGGDVAGVKEQLLREYDGEIGRLFSIYQRSGSVHSLLQ